MLLKNIYTKKFNKAGFAVIVLDDLENERAVNQNAKDFAAKSIEDKNNEILYLKRKVSDLTCDLDEYKIKFEFLEKEVLRQNESITSQNDQISNLILKNNSLKRELHDCQREIKRLTEKNETMALNLSHFGIGYYSLEREYIDLLSQSNAIDDQRRINNQFFKQFSLQLKTIEENYSVQKSNDLLHTEKINTLNVEIIDLRNLLTLIQNHMEALDRRSHSQLETIEECRSIQKSNDSLHAEKIDTLNAEIFDLRNLLTLIQNHMEALDRRSHNQYEEKIANINELKQHSIEDTLYNMLKDHGTMTSYMNRIANGSLRNHHRSVFWGDRLLTLDKSAGFYEDAVFKDQHKKINSPKYYDQYGGPDGIAWRLNTLVWAGRNALELEGDFIECGVFKGDMSWVIANVLNWREVKKTFFLYDTFEGFSPKYTTKDEFPFNPNFFEYANKIYRIPDLYKKVKKRFKGIPNIRIIKGVVPDVLVDNAPLKIAYLHIDLNSTAPEIGALEVLFDRVVSGGFIIFDDYGWLEYINQKRAEDAFMASRGYQILELPTGQGIVIKR